MISVWIIFHLWCLMIISQCSELQWHYPVTVSVTVEGQEGSRWEAHFFQLQAERVHLVWEALAEDPPSYLKLSLNTGSVRQKADLTHIKSSRVTFQSQLISGPGTGRKSVLAVQATGPTIKGDISNCTSTHYSGAGTTRGTSGLSKDKYFSLNFTSHCRLGHFTNSGFKNLFTYAGGKTLTYFSNAIYTKWYKKS